MAIDTPARHIYSGDGSTRVFPIPTYIQGDDYIRIEINGVHQVDRSKWDIVNNSIIFVTAPISESTIDVQVATSVESLAELGSVTNVDIVAGSIADINDIASNLDEILLADDNAIIATTKANEASVSATTASTKASEALASATSASSSEIVATTKANESSTSASTATTKANEASVSATTASTKASEALASATSASTSATTASLGATTATTKASEASTSASNALASETKAKKWADESEDVPVESGLYSAKHWAAKAADIVGAGLIDDVSPSTSTVFSSTKSNNIYEPKNSNIQGHISNTTNPHNVTKSQVGLSNVDNTSDVNKPISAATATALAGKQATLVSGSNIKTINGLSVLGSGNIILIDNSSNQSIAGIKTFASSPIVPTPTAQDNSTKVATTAYVDGKMVLGTAVNSTSGTSIDFTGIPSWAKKVTVLFNGVSTNGTSNILIQLGTSGGIENTSYVSSNSIITTASTAGSASVTTGFGTTMGGGNMLASNFHSGKLDILCLTSNTYVCNGNISTQIGIIYTTCGNKTLSGILNRIRITTVNGIDTFDAGQINILYEG